MFFKAPPCLFSNSEVHGLLVEEKLDKVNLDDSDYLLKILTFISVKVAGKTKEARQELLEKRKAAFKEKNDSLYKAILETGIELDEKHVRDLMTIVMKML